VTFLRLTAGLLVGGGFAVIVTSLLLARRRSDLDLEELLDLPYGEDDVDVTAVVRTTGVGERAIMLASQLVEQVDTKGTIRDLLERARIPLRTGELVGITAGGGVIGAFVVWMLSGQILMAMGTMAVAPVVTRSVLKFRIRRRIQRFDSDLPEVVALIASSMSAGHTFARAIQMASSESEGPVAEELRRVVLETQLGQPLVDALDHLRDRVRLESVDLLVDAVRVQQQVGGSLTDLLHSLAEFIRARHELTREVKVLTAEGRMSATVLGALPLFMLLAMGTLNPGYTDPLFQGWGIVWLAMSAGMVALGVAWIRKLSDLEV